jgi:lanosterol synthase
MFLIPGIIIAMYVTKTPVPQEWKVEITRYLANMQRTGGEDDQGWGIHIEARSSVFGTGLNYVAMRLLGVDAEVSSIRASTRTFLSSVGC